MSVIGTINGKTPKGNILVVNTGSITTKFAYYRDGEVVLDRKLEHSVEELSQFADVMDQDQMRTHEILDALKKDNIRLEDIDIVMAWRGQESGIEAAAAGRKVVMTPSDFCSFDYYQANPKYQPQAIGQTITLAKVYSFDPVPKEHSAAASTMIVGGQCELWTEYINRWAQAEYMLLPRLCAMSEVLWTPAHRKDWARFRAKVESHKLRFAALDYNFCEGSFKPLVKMSRHQGDSFTVSVSSEIEGTYVYYTTDGTMPTLESPTYVEPLVLKEGTMLRLRSVFNGLPQEEVYDYVIK